MGKTSTASKRAYNERVYDRLAVTVPKGQKQAVAAFAHEHDESVNGMVNRLLWSEMGLSEDTWRGKPTEAEEE